MFPVPDANWWREEYLQHRGRVQDLQNRKLQQNFEERGLGSGLARHLLEEYPWHNPRNDPDNKHGYKLAFYTRARQPNGFGNYGQATLVEMYARDLQDARTNAIPYLIGKAREFQATIPTDESRTVSFRVRRAYDWNGEADGHYQSNWKHNRPMKAALAREFAKAFDAEYGNVDDEFYEGGVEIYPVGYTGDH